jgi:hypothetical protein
VIRTVIIVLAALSLAACLAAPILFFLGSVEMVSYKNVLLAGTLGWFICASILAARRRSG